MSPSRIHPAATVFVSLLLAWVMAGLAAEPAAAGQNSPGAEIEHGSPLQPAAPAWSNGPDDFGYTLVDSLSSAWIDATAGTNTGMTGSNQQVGPVTLPFAFPFYENAYASLYISTNGTIGFSGALTQDSQEYAFPNPAAPNNVIAANWAPEDVSTGGVYHLGGGAAPGRWFAVEWHQVRDAYPDSHLTFEIVLYENGNIEFRYQTVYYGASWGRYTPGVGIEDGRGRDGLYYNADRLTDGRVVSITRPPASARVSLWPRSGRGTLAPAGTTVRCNWTVSNHGEFGVDTYNVEIASAWAAQALGADGLTPLQDTDGDTVADTGPVAQGAETNTVITLRVPDGALLGDHATATVTFRSSRDPARSKVITCQAAVAAPFAQAYNNGYYPALLRLQHPAGGVDVTVKPDWGSFTTVAETPAHTFVYAWSASRTTPATKVWVGEIEYALVDRFGDIQRPAAKLTDHTNASLNISDSRPQAAAAPDGRTGVIWQRYEQDPAASKSRYNLYFAILDPAGAPVFGPENLTNNASWGSSGGLNVPTFETPRITSTDDNRFVLVWRRYHYESAGLVSDIFAAVRDTAGAGVSAPIRHTADAPGSADGSGYSSPSVAAMAGSRSLLIWAGGATQDLSYKIITSGGETTRATERLTNDGSISAPNWEVDAARVSSGNMVLAWSYGRDRSSVARAAVLNPAGDIVKSPFTLANPVAPQGNGKLSVAPAGDKAVLTWRDGYYNYRYRLFYALLSGQGEVLTPPMIFRNAEAEGTYLEPGDSTSYGWTPPDGVDGVAAIAPAGAYAAPGGTTTLTLSYANHGGQVARNVVLTATLGDGLTYLGDSLGASGGSSVRAAGSGQVTWQLPDLAFLERGAFKIYVRAAAEKPLGARLPLTVSLATSTGDVHPADNQAGADVVVSALTFLPLIMR